ncbi:ribosomal protein L18ae [Tritrichomonas foetus]|uniref:60S ribosomal protein L18a n=1 Tax=Tritrichomonas foetus TaxID=1144522 RepID=A0A1J4JAD6_9EUKA|nr:ribosomal protein L18ae [Tritrichomonas foetus]OHS94603.1 ribosomal protein L18ae [Tritrichomonas foetus]|eukprot:OHS94603.1 ribosomal protein L18ae [Tritrichomonas foetus]
MLKNYEVIARPNPTDKVPNPPAIRVQVFANDEVVAKSKFWTVASRIARLKPVHGEILAIKQVIEPEPTRVKSYGIWLTFNSVRGTHNIYKEFRDTTTEGAVVRLYQEMAGTHNVHQHQISIIRIAEIPPKDVKHRHVQQFVDAENAVKYPISKTEIRPTHSYQKKILSHKRPTVCGF